MEKMLGRKFFEKICMKKTVEKIENTVTICFAQLFFCPALKLSPCKQRE